METVGKILTDAGWKREPDHQPTKDDPVRQVYSRGRRRAYVGSMWTSFYERVGDGNITWPESVKVDDVAAVRARAAG